MTQFQIKFHWVTKKRVIIINLLKIFTMQCIRICFLIKLENHFFVLIKDTLTHDGVGQGANETVVNFPLK
jgi:hypothetical protein